MAVIKSDGSMHPAGYNGHGERVDSSGTQGLVNTSRSAQVERMVAQDAWVYAPEVAMKNRNFRCEKRATDEQPLVTYICVCVNLPGLNLIDALDR